MQFSVQQSELAAQLGLDTTDTDQLTLIKRWLNMSQRMILGHANWPFLRASSPLVVQTVADYTTGTATVSAGGTTVTFSGTIAASKTGQFIRFASSLDWYRITAHTAGTSTATISPAAISANTAATYTIRKFFYSTDTTVDRIISIRQSIIPPYYLSEVSKESFDETGMSPDVSRTPEVYMIAGKDSSSIVQFAVWPVPNAVINLYVDYYPVTSDLSSDADVSVIPEKWHATTMLDGAKMLGYQWKDDNRYVDAKRAFEDGLEDMKKNMLLSTKIDRGFQAVDRVGRKNDFPFPANYPNV